MKQKYPQLLIIDLNDVIDNHRVLSGMYDVYNKFPLQEMISTILQVPANMDYSEKINMEVENRFADILDDFGYDDPSTSNFLEQLELFLDNLAMILDEHIARKVRPNFNYGEYAFERWVDNSSVMLKLRVY